MAIQGFFTGDVKIRDLNGVLKAVDGIVEVATDAGTVTSVGLTVGSTGTDVNVANSPITTSGSITLNIPTSSATNRGLLSSADWSTFNSKQGTITLTTTGSSGAATLIGTTLNIPNYSGALSGYVPYTGATTNVDLGEYGISSGYFQADLTPSGALQVGRMQWNSTDGTMDLRLMGNNVTLQIGQEQVARVVNGTGGNLLESNYQAVKIIGAQGQRLQVGLARADSDANSKDTLGLVTENINNNQEGFITVSGLVNEIDTTGSLQGETWADGDTLYLSGTTSGAVTNVKPTAPTHTVIVGFVVYAHANHGKIFVKIDNGYELEELHDVAPTPYVNKGVLYRDTATNLWKSATIGTLLGYTPANAATTLTINGTAYDLSANRTWSVGTVTSIGTSGPITGGTITGSGTIGITQATTSTDGYLSSTDWNTFYNKQAAGSYITALTGEATASGPGSATVTLSTSAVTGKLLTGLNLTGGGSIAATDSVLQAFGKVQNQISGLAGGVTYQGTWNASTNTPTLTSSVGTKGYYYIVDVAGSTNLNGITDWKVGDWAIFNGSTWDKVDNTDAVSSVNGFTGAVSLTTSNIAEGTNLYYLDSRARLALSFTAGSGAYDNTTGVITIPTNTSQLTNGANFITLSSLSASSPLAYNSGTGAFSIQVATGSQNGYLSSTDWTTFNGKQDALTLTTTGSSGSATLVGATLNVPTYTLSGLGGVPTSRQLTINGTAYDLSADRSWSVGTHTGSLTSGYVPKATGSTTLTDGLLYDTGSAVLLGTQTAGSGKFMVYSSTADNHYQAIGTAPSFRFADTITSPTYTGIIGLATASNHFIIGAAAGDMVLANNTSSVGNFLFGTGATERMRINATTGNVSIGNTGNTFKLEVTGTTKISGQLTLGSTITNGTYTYTLPSATGTIALVGGSGVGTVTSIATTGPITGGTITSTGTIGITQSGAASDGYLSSTDWNTFNNKQSALTNPVTGTGTTNYLPKFTGTSTIGDSAVTDDGTTVTLVSRALSGTSATFVSTAATNNAARYNVSIGDNSSVAAGNGGGILFRGVYTGTTLVDAAAISSFKANATDGDYGYGLSFVTRANGGDLTSRLIISPSGNLGLGVTPSAWLSSVKVIQVGGAGSIWSTNSTNNTFVSSNEYLNSSANPIYILSDYATRYQQYSGQHIWYNAPSGTAGNAISFTQAMTLNASGNLSLGNTNDTYKLDVSGASRILASTYTAGSILYLRDAAATGSNTTFAGLFLGSSPGTDFVLGKQSTNTVGSFAIKTGGGTTLMTLSDSGAATFSSSVTQSASDSRLLGGDTAGRYIISNSDTSAYMAIYGSSSATANQIGIITNSLITFNTGSGYAERMRITSGGQVLIGQTAASGSSNGIYFRPGIESGFIVTSDVALQLSRLGTTGDIQTFYSGTTRVGKIAVGSSTVTFESANNGGLSIASTGAATFSSSIDMGLNKVFSGGGYKMLYRNSTVNITYSGTSNWQINNDADNVALMTVLNGGSVGIGTTSPGSLLDVVTSTAYDGVIRVRSTGTNTPVVAMGVDAVSSPDGYVGTQNNVPFGIRTNDVNRIWVTTAGNVGIGTTSPMSVGSYRVLDIQGSSGAMMYLSSNGSDGGRIYGNSGGLTYDATAAGHLWYTPGGERMRMLSTGEVLINATATTASAKFYVNGIAAFGSAYVGSLGTGLVYSSGGTLTSTNPSDQRLKNTIKPLSYGLNEILQLNPKTFYYNDDVNKEKLKYGFIAQEVKVIMPELARKLNAETDYLGLETEGIYVTLVNAIKEQQNQINELKSQLK